MKPKKTQPLLPTDDTQQVTINGHPLIASVFKLDPEDGSCWMFRLVSGPTADDSGPTQSIELHSKGAWVTKESASDTLSLFLNRIGAVPVTYPQEGHAEGQRIPDNITQITEDHPWSKFLVNQFVYLAWDVGPLLKNTKLKVLEHGIGSYKGFVRCNIEDSNTKDWFNYDDLSTGQVPNYLGFKDDETIKINTSATHTEADHTAVADCMRSQYHAFRDMIESTYSTDGPSKEWKPTPTFINCLKSACIAESLLGYDKNLALILEKLEPPKTLVDEIAHLAEQIRETTMQSYEIYNLMSDILKRHSTEPA